MTPFNYSARYPVGYRVSGKTDWPDIRRVQYPVQPYLFISNPFVHDNVIYNNVFAVQYLVTSWDERPSSFGRIYVFGPKTGFEKSGNSPGLVKPVIQCTVHMDHLRQYSANNIQQREFTTFFDKTKQKILFTLVCTIPV